MPCPHGMPTPGSCVDCMDEGLLPPPPRPQAATPMGAPFRARYAGTCRGCTFGISEGEVIVRMSDDTYRHYDRPGCG